MSDRIKRLEKLIEKHGEQFICEKLNVNYFHLRYNLLAGKSQINLIKLQAIENIA